MNDDEYPAHLFDDGLGAARGCVNAVLIMLGVLAVIGLALFVFKAVR